MPLPKNFGAFRHDCWSAQLFTSRSRASTDAGPPSAVEGVTSDGDAELMLRARDGDDAAFEVLVERFRHPLYGFLFRMVNGQAVAEELAQETFLRMYRSKSSDAANAKLATWMYRIAADLAIQHQRNGGGEQTNTVPAGDRREDNSAARTNVPDSSPSAELISLRRDRVAALRLQMDALPEDERIAVLLHKYQGLDYGEIAAVLTVSESAAKSLLLRGYETLWKKLPEFM